MRTIETTAKTSEEAIEIALKELNVDRVDVEIDVVSKGKPGLLGIVGGELAKVRVSVMDKPPDIVKVSMQILEELISLMGVSAIPILTQAQHEDVGGPVVQIDGDDSGLLIGRRGETLRALQFVVAYLTGRRLDERVRLIVDVAGYQDRRYKSVTTLALRVAQRVVTSGKSITLEAMPANERRVVHMALADRQGVNTISTGEGDNRRVVVEPLE